MRSSARQQSLSNDAYFRSGDDGDDAPDRRISVKDTDPAPGRKRSPAGCLKNLSVLRAFRILKAFDNPDEWVAASELARRTKIHEATLNRFAHSLVDVGALVRNDRGSYRCVIYVMPGAQSGR